MSQLSRTFDPLPSAMSEADFLAVFGGVYEHSAWVAEQVWRGGLRERHDDVDGLAQAMARVVDTANAGVKHTLINNHPDLAGRAAVAGELTAESTEEQSSAGIHLCTPAEFEQFTRFNRNYKRRFGITFVMAVKHSNRHQILAAFEERLSNDPTTEFRRAISEIHKIARFRLEAIAEAAPRND
ncbi:MAG: 2-oxo-4-hydroxy-4-carboxy-5-ureidoimidazoline decarboxylase [Woeseiaceae bacterium]